MADAKIRLRVLAEYECWPLWQEVRNGVRNLAPEDLGLPESLASGFHAWARKYEETFDPTYPMNSGFADVASENEFYAQGLELAREMAAMIGDDAEVYFLDGRTGQSTVV